MPSPMQIAEEISKGLKSIIGKHLPELNPANVEHVETWITNVAHGTGPERALRHIGSDLHGEAFTIAGEHSKQKFYDIAESLVGRIKHSPDTIKMAIEDGGGQLMGKMTGIVEGASKTGLKLPPRP